MCECAIFLATKDKFWNQYGASTFSFIFRARNDLWLTGKRSRKGETTHIKTSSRHVCNTEDRSWTGTSVQQESQDSIKPISSWYCRPCDHIYQHPAGHYLLGLHFAPGAWRCPSPAYFVAVCLTYCRFCNYLFHDLPLRSTCACSMVRCLEHPDGTGGQSSQPRVNLSNI